MAQRFPTLIYAAPMLALLMHGTNIAAAQSTTPTPTSALTPPAPPAQAPQESIDEAAAPPEKPRHRGEGGGRWGKQKKKRHSRGPMSPEALEKLSPEERERFLKNFERWKKLPPDQRSSLRNRELNRRQRIEKETRETLEKSNIPLSENQRNFFIERYELERKQLETDLRKEMDEKRRKGIEELSAKLLKEAQAQPVEGPKPGKAPEKAPEATAPASTPAPGEAAPGA